MCMGVGGVCVCMNMGVCSQAWVWEGVCVSKGVEGVCA